MTATFTQHGPIAESQWRRCNGNTSMQHGKAGMPFTASKNPPRRQLVLGLASAGTRGRHSRSSSPSAHNQRALKPLAAVTAGASATLSPKLLKRDMRSHQDNSSFLRDDAEDMAGTSSMSINSHGGAMIALGASGTLLLTNDIDVQNLPALRQPHPNFHPSTQEIECREAMPPLLDEETQPSGNFFSLFEASESLSSKAEPSQLSLDRSSVVTPAKDLHSADLRVSLSLADRARLLEVLHATSPATVDSTSTDDNSQGTGTAAALASQVGKPETAAVKAGSADPNSDKIKDLVKRFLKNKTGTSTSSTDGGSTSTTKKTSAAAAAAATIISRSKPNKPSSSSKLSDRLASKGSAPAAAITKTKPSKAAVATAASTVSISTKVSSGSAKVISSSIKVSSTEIKVSSSRRKTTGSTLQDLDAVLAKHRLPQDVAAAVGLAVAAKQLPASPASLDTLFARLLENSSGIKHELIHAVLKRNPAALKQSSEKLRGKLVSLKKALSCTDVELLAMLGTTRNLLGLKAETIKGKLGSLAGVLGLPPAEISALVRKCPHLLSCSADTIASKFKGLKHLVQGSQAEVVRMVLETPQLLFLNPQSIEAKFHDLSTLLDLSPRRMGQMVLSKPMLLTSSTETLKERWLALSQVTSSNSRWCQELKGLAPATLAAVLLASKVKVRRLAFLVSAQRQEAVALTSLLNMTQPEFISKFPDYRKWTAPPGM